MCLIQMCYHFRWIALLLYCTFEWKIKQSQTIKVTYEPNAIHHENEINNLMETKQYEYNNKVKSKSK